MERFKLYPWLILLFSVWGVVSILLLSSESAGIRDSVLIGGGIGLFTVFFISMTSGKLDPNRMALDDLDSGDDLN